jgi:PAS domain S-box-containing protein
MYSKVSGYSQDELIGNTYSLLRDKSFSKHIYQNLWETILSKSSWHGIIKNINKNQKEYYTRVTIYPILDKDDEVIEFIAVGYEVTQEILQERDKNKKIITTKTNFVQKTKDRETEYIKEINNLIDKNKKLSKYVKSIDKEPLKENKRLKEKLAKKKKIIKELELDSIQKEKKLKETINNYYIKNVDLVSRNEYLETELKKYKQELKKLSKISISKLSQKDKLPSYIDKDKEKKMRG